MSKLKVLSMALAVGLAWGLGIMLLGWAAAAGWGAKVVDVLASLYLGYAPTFLGGIVGGLWAFGDGFLCGLVVSALYNVFAGDKKEAIPILSRTEQPAH